MKNKHYKFDSENGEINRVDLAPDTMIHVNLNEECTAYIRNFTKEKTVIHKQLWITDLIPNYKGPSVYFDLDEQQRLIGIEIIE